MLQVLEKLLLRATKGTPFGPQIPKENKKVVPRSTLKIIAHIMLHKRLLGTPFNSQNVAPATFPPAPPDRREIVSLGIPLETPWKPKCGNCRLTYQSNEFTEPIPLVMPQTAHRASKGHPVRLNNICFHSGAFCGIRGCQHGA